MIVINTTDAMRNMMPSGRVSIVRTTIKPENINPLFDRAIISVANVADIKKVNIDVSSPLVAYTQKSLCNTSAMLVSGMEKSKMFPSLGSFQLRYIKSIIEEIKKVMPRNSDNETGSAVINEPRAMRIVQRKLV
jgi:hypothetical protein